MDNPFNNNFFNLFGLFFCSVVDVKFRHLPVINSPSDDDNHKCLKFDINESHLNKALEEGLSEHKKIRHLEKDMDFKSNLINTTTISSLARHIIPAKNQHKVLDLLHEQRPYEEASKIIAKKYYS